jgi:hypothetical protein
MVCFILSASIFEMLQHATEADHAFRFRLFITKPECILLIKKQKITCILLSIEQSKTRDDIIHNAKM